MSNVAFLKYYDDCGKWKAHYKGMMLCQSANKFRVVQLIETGECKKALELGVTTVSEETPHVNLNNVTPIRAPRRVEPVAAPKPYFSVNQRFEFLENLTDMVIEGRIPSLLVTGDGGLGKTHTVISRFNAAGLQNALEFITESDGQVKDDIAGMGDYLTVKGYSTAKGMYRTLYQNRNRVIVYDDCDKVLEDKTAIGLLKGALDSSGKRYLSWDAELPADSDVPKRFEFKGGVIFISNKNQNQIDGAIKTRCMRVDVSMTTAEKLERMQSILANVLPEMPVDVKRDSFEFLKEHAEMATELSIRTLLNVCKVRNSNLPTWKELAMYSITA